jgi:hypothetical protein
MFQAFQQKRPRTEKYRIKGPLFRDNHFTSFLPASFGVEGSAVISDRAPIYRRETSFHVILSHFSHLLDLK